MPSSFFLFCWGMGLYFPIPKERKLIEKVIEFDQSIEAHLRERDLCSEWVEGVSGAESRHRLRIELADDFVCFLSRLLHALALQFSFLAVFFFVNLPLQFINLPFFFFFFFFFLGKNKMYKLS